MNLLNTSAVFTCLLLLLYFSDLDLCRADYQEGEFASISVKQLRRRQMRNFFLCLMVSQVCVINE